MSMWYAIVRFEDDYIDQNGKVWPYPKQGVPIVIYDSKERAEMVNRGSSGNYRVVQVQPVAISG